MRTKPLKWAIAKRDVRRYFNNPTGYIFITLFIFLGGTAAVWRPRFFLNNLANLDQLNEVFPLILLFFVPALTMGVWSEERKQGTEELLLTLPATPFEVLIGKTLASAAIYTIAVVTSLSHVLVLYWLGRPDPGLVAANYLGYWIAGCALIPAGICASLLTANQTIAFILAVVFCAVAVLPGPAAGVFNASLGRQLAPAGLPFHLSQFSNGILSLASIIYFCSLAVFFTYLNTIILGRSRWRAGGRSLTIARAIQVVSLLIIFASAVSIVRRVDIRADLTSEQLHTIAFETKRLLGQLPADHPVLIQAFVSPNVPEQYVQPRENLLSTLREIDVLAGDNVRIVVEPTDAYSAAGRTARERFGILPRVASDPQSTRPDPQEIFLSIAFTSGANEQVLPFFDRGMSAEYEIVRGIRAVGGSRRKRIGVVDTEARVLGGMDFETARSRLPWAIVEELRREYEIVKITPWDPIEPASVDALLVVLPSTLLQREMDHVAEAIAHGTPALVLLDPLPTFDMRLAPAATMAARINPYRSDAIAVPEKNVGDIQKFTRALGIKWSPARIAWDSYRPHPELAQLPREVIFVGRGNGNAQAFAPQAATARLQEVVLMYPGYLEPDETSGVSFEPLLSTGTLAGGESYFQLVQPSAEGPALNLGLPHEPEGKALVLAAQVRRSGGTPTGTVIVSADLDLIADQMFELRASRPANASFDNITFFLNCLDVLTGDDSLLALRSRRVRHRTLERVEGQTRAFLERRMREEQEASSAAKQALDSARKAVDERVQEIEKRPDLDPQAKAILARNLQETEKRRLSVLESKIELDKEAKIRASRETMETEVRRIEAAIRTAAVALPPVPMALLGLWVFVRRQRRERRMAARAGRIT